MFGQRSTEADARVDDLTKSIDDQGGAISRANRQSAAKILADKGILEAAKQVGIDTRDVTSAYLGNETARRKLTTAVDAGIAQAPAASRASQTGTVLTREQVNAYFELRTQLGLAFDEYDKSTAGQARVAAATEDVTGKTRTWTTAAEDAKEKLDAQKAAADRLKISIDILSGANIDVTQAQIAYAKAQQTLTAGIKETVEENKKKTRGQREDATSLDVNTAAGQKNLTNITGLAQASASYATAVAQRAGSEEAGRVVMEKARVAFVAQAGKIGFTKDEVIKLTAAYFKVPKRVPTEIELKIETAKRKAADIQRKISQIKGKTVTVHVNQSGDLQRITNDLQYIKGFGTIPVNIRVNGKILGASKGGEVQGGVPGKDSVPALLMPGERVLTTAQNRLWKLEQRSGRGRPGVTAAMGGSTLQLDPADRALLRQVALAAGRPVELRADLRLRGADLLASLDRTTTERSRR